MKKASRHRGIEALNGQGISCQLSVISATSPIFHNSIPTSSPCLGVSVVSLIKMASRHHVGAILGTLGHGEFPALTRRNVYRKNNRAQHVTYWAMENLTKEIFDE